MIPAIRIGKTIFDALLCHATESIPNECCGLLIGQSDEIVHLCRARNVNESSTKFLIHPADHFSAIRDARSLKMQVIGSYHSHPNSPAIPSATDVAQSDDPDFLQVIISPPNIRCYRIVGGRYFEVQIIVPAV